MMGEKYIKATMYGTDRRENIFKRVSSFFFREAESNHGLGSHYIVDLVGDGGGDQLVSVICENHGIPIIDLRDDLNVDNIRDVVNSILETSPPRCAFIVDCRENHFMQQVRSRIMHKYCDLRYKRVVFCLTDQETVSGTCIQVPGSIDDRMSMLLYHIPEIIQHQVVSLECFRPLAAEMVDYSLLWPMNWRHVRVDGTSEEFMSTAMYQIIRRVRADDPGIVDGYPSFEMEWRSMLARRLHDSLPNSPDALCPTIHRVIPIGVSASDAMQAMTVAIPEDIQDPYTITTHSSAVDDKCGSIVITQPLCHTIVNVNCMIDPGILVDVCRDLRAAHRDVVSRMHTVSTQLTKMQDETRSQLSDMKNTTRIQLDNMEAMVARLVGAANISPDHICSKKGCSRIVTKRFRSGKAPRQCSNCLSYTHTIQTNVNGPPCAL